MKSRNARHVWATTVGALLLAAAAGAQTPPEAGLLFHLSGDHGLVADYSAGGTPKPNYQSDVTVSADGAKGPGLSCGHTQLLSYWAPGNIYAERGTLSFFWRSREPVGPTAFPVFRVGYGDHSSWDMVWLRIDYNGKNGFDAFVTDIGLARTRVSMTMPVFPKPDEWVHLALAWDESQGIRFYVNGQLAGRKDGVAVFDAALDQFGPHSRIISPYQVQSAYNFVRGGDIDELRIYDRMLSDGNVAALAKHQAPGELPALARGLETPASRAQWMLRHGWNRAGDVPPALASSATRVRKVEIHDAYDIKRWWWKGTDGIRETTWPGVYNRSRLAGRNDYFQLPDWDCYSTSGQSVTFNMPNEPWNHLEVSGAAFGTLALTPEKIAAAGSGKKIFDRPQGQDRTFHRLASPVTGQNVLFTNVEQETPISEFAAYHVSEGAEPRGVARRSYRLTATAQPAYPSLEDARQFIEGRFPAGARATMVGLSANALRLPAEAPPAPGLPIVHVLIPSGFRDVVDFGLPRHNPTPASFGHVGGGLDGIAIDLPALKVAPTHGDVVALNVTVKDPIWPMRAMLDFTFSVKPGTPHTLWLDLRDRILPEDKGLYLTIASASPEFGPAALEGAEVRLVFKERKDALAEHTADRFTQARDNLAHLLEERPSNRRLNVYRRFEADLSDLLRVDPEHVLGRQYWWEYNRDSVRPPFTVTEPPAGVPTWAQRQVEQVAQAAKLVNWYIDNRQIENGEFGGGLSDDGDFTNWWPGSALMGATPDKIKKSLMRHLDAFYEQGLFTNGLSTIQADELHSYEEGIQVLGQAMLLDHGGPETVARAMETAAALERLTGINKAGHRHIRSSYFSGSVIAEETVWGWSKGSSYLVLHPAIALVEFNGAPRVRKLLLELADGVIAHGKSDGKGGFLLPGSIHFASDADGDAGTMGSMDRAWPLLWAAYRWTGDPKYLQPMKAVGPRGLSNIASNAIDLMGVRAEWGPQIVAAADGPTPGSDAMRHFAWQVSGDTKRLEDLYYDQIGDSKLREFINTEGSVWIDRVTLPDGEIQRARLGGVASTRNSIYPGHVVSWAFAAPATAESVAVLVPSSTREKVRILAYNLETSPVMATMTAWDVTPGTWTVTQGLGGDDHGAPPSQATSRTVSLGRSEDLEFTLAPRALTVIELTLAKKGVPYWQRPDLGISSKDVAVNGSAVKVTVHSVGAAATPGARVVLRDKAGKTLATTGVPGMAAPLDLKPKSATVTLTVPAGADLAGGSVTVEAGRTLEITQKNNRVVF